MNVVLYTHDLEPITIINLAGRDYGCCREYLKRGYFSLAPYLPLHSAVFDDAYPHAYRQPPVVRIQVEWIQRYNIRIPILLTHDEEAALLLKAAFLPGQQAAVREHYERGIGEGIRRAFGMLSGLAGED